MKRFIMTGAAFAALTCSALAADMPAVEPMPVAVPFSWTGFYVGIHGGGAWGDTDNGDYFDYWSEYGGDNEFDVDGFVIGGQIGYLWQVDSIVFGIEADGSFVDLGDDLAFVDEEEEDTWNFSLDGSYLASVRGRLGVAFDRFLVYGTGGVGFTGLDLDWAYNEDTYSDDANFVGWVAGVGIEYAFTDNISLGVEYLHYGFGDEIFDNEDWDDQINTDFSVDVVRGRLNVKFDSLFN